MRLSAVLLTALLLANPVTFVLATGATVPDASPETAPRPARQLPIRLHGKALAGTERRLDTDTLDTLAAQTHWAIWDPYRLTEVQYSGITLIDLVQAVAPGATGVRMRAVNDYVVTFTRDEWHDLPILLATRDNGLRMDVAHKGPARIVYRQTRDNELSMQVHGPKWIWQVIDVEFLAD